LRQWIWEILSPRGRLSALRVMSLMCVLFAGLISLIGLLTKVELAGLTMLVSAFLASAFGGKIAQHKNEVVKPEADKQDQ
jgi:hypothetical protein